MPFHDPHQRHFASAVKTVMPDGSHPYLQNRVHVYTGNVATSATPVVLETVLGSCVAVCLYDPRFCMGGMNHILLPGAGLDTCSTRFGVHAMELLINQLMKQGGDRRNFIAKAFGGANVLHGMKTAAIGDDNARFVREFLAAEKIPLVAQRLGGAKPIRVYFKTDTGKATVRSVDGSQLPKIIHAEDYYLRSHLADRDITGEITLF